MLQILPFVVAGIVTGAIYGLAATGLVLTYKTAGILNFGHGAIATFGAYVFYYFYVQQQASWIVAAVVAVLVAGPVAGLVMEFVARRLSHQRTAWKIVGTAGLILLMQGAGTLKYGPDTRPVRQYLPSGNEMFRLFDVNVRYSQVTVLVAATLVVLALTVLFKKTRLGLTMRAVVEDPNLADVQGVSPVRVRRVSWVLGCTIASMSGVLILPFLGLDPILLTFLVVQSFAAAAVGRFASISMTFVGGILVGVGEAVISRYELTYPALLGMSKALPFVVLIGAMLLLPKRTLLPPSTFEHRPALLWHGPRSLRFAAYVVVFGALASVPLWAPGYKLTPYWTGALTMAMMILALGLLVRTAGIVSLCSAAFAAIGAVAFSQLQLEAGFPWILAILAAGLIAVPVGALVAIPAIRLSGLFLALATLGFGLLVERLLYRRGWMFTTLAAGRSMPRPSWAQSDVAYYYVVMAFLLATVVLVGVIHRARLGRLLWALSDSAKAVSTLGVDVRVTRVIVFCTSAFIAAVAGALYGAMLGSVGPTNSYFTSFNSVVLLAILALAPFRVPWYGLFAGITAVIPGYLPGENTTSVMNVLFGFFAVLVATQGGPAPMPKRLQEFFESKFGRAGRRSAHPSSTGPRVERTKTPPARLAPGSSALTVEHLTIRFGGLVAVNDVSLKAKAAQITGLIGPNGAGKTTTFNACSGFDRPSKGTVKLHDRDITHRSPSARARLGLGRTFQVMELCDSLTVADNVGIGWEASRAGAAPWRQLIAGRHELSSRDAAVQEAMELCEVTDVAGVQAGSLSTGQRRLVELARCLAGPFDTLLLDEPSSGLGVEETRRFAAILREVVRERGCGILLVEHDMSLVMGLCDYIYVLDFGQLVFEGTPSEVAQSREVQAAYLGAEQTGTRERPQVGSAAPIQVSAGGTA
ncbi:MULTISPECIES: branched-chain amino acid ABC transporter permease/ATP-binding protein [unclassified Pseudofrankia]|uniref:branched-chain amino acid ABC transporter permease/ATP-binding protein n=1 Tax=unclassified Pseudofrankia TaxID=2994372 RepID=UPI0008D9B4FE|nr:MULTISPECIES: branched-chain amino acid ABC transporter permease/ATP-binding protein [unclassified Pseudofrankia]MDT3445634.1 branched-chain amino acid ABC transporter permease/ATP-binding protein [Pseudofrankia sp. BMG5.37]OHV63520.1 branched-chain amino acid ABC transporter permease/ATP-binding protein [Pseudofrankia sp. BMG5.36]